MPDMTPGEVLAKAADLIDEHGWWDGQSSFPFKGPRLCAALAIKAAARDSWDVQSLAFRQLASFTGAGSGGLSVADWNDAHTHAEVVSAMRAAATQ